MKIPLFGLLLVVACANSERKRGIKGSYSQQHESQLQEAEAVTASMVEYVDRPLAPLYNFLMQRRLQKFCKLLRDANLDQILQDIGGSWTIFVPTDDSFVFLPGGVLEELKNNPDLLREFLLRHFVVGDFPSQQIQNEMLVDSVQGTPLRFNVYGQIITVSGAQILEPDLEFELGRIHVIDHPIYAVPEDDILNYLQKSNRQLYRLVTDTGLGEYLASGPFTILAPDDQAFDFLSLDLKEALATNKSLAESVVINHILPGTIYVGGIIDGMQWETAGGSIITFNSRRGLTFVNGIPIVITDVPVVNGIIHVINRVLLPEGIEVDCQCEPSSSSSDSPQSPFPPNPSNPSFGQEQPFAFGQITTQRPGSLSPSQQHTRNRIPPGESSSGQRTHNTPSPSRIGHLPRPQNSIDSPNNKPVNHEGDPTETTQNKPHHIRSTRNPIAQNGGPTTRPQIQRIPTHPSRVPWQGQRSRPQQNDQLGPNAFPTPEDQAQRQPNRGPNSHQIPPQRHTTSTRGFQPPHFDRTHGRTQTTRSYNRDSVSTQDPFQRQTNPSSDVFTTQTWHNFQTESPTIKPNNWQQRNQITRQKPTNQPNRPVTTPPRSGLPSSPQRRQSQPNQDNFVTNTPPLQTIPPGQHRTGVACRRRGDRVNTFTRNLPLCPESNMQTCQNAPYDPTNRLPLCPDAQHSNCRNPNETFNSNDLRPVCPGQENTQECKNVGDPTFPGDRRKFCSTVSTQTSILSCRRADEVVNPQDRRPLCPDVPSDDNDCRPFLERPKPGDKRPVCKVNSQTTQQWGRPNHQQQTTQSPSQQPTTTQRNNGHSGNQSTRKPWQSPHQSQDQSRNPSTQQHRNGNKPIPGSPSSRPPSRLNEPVSGPNRIPSRPGIHGTRQQSRTHLPQTVTHPPPTQPNFQPSAPRWGSPQNNRQSTARPHSTGSHPHRGSQRGTSPSPPNGPRNGPHNDAPPNQQHVRQPSTSQRRPVPFTPAPLRRTNAPQVPTSAIRTTTAGDDTRRSLYEIVEDPALLIRGHPVRLTKIFDLFHKAGIENILIEPGPKTVFLPSDDAFALLPAGVVDQLEEYPELLKQVLLYHVSNAEVLPSPNTDSFTIPSLQGNQLVISMLNGGRLILISGAKAVAVTRANNGIFYVINQLLYPLPYNDIASAVKSRPDLSQFSSLLEQSGLMDTLQGETPHTLFAPTDEAFAALPLAFVEEVRNNVTATRELLQNHLIGGAHYGREFLTGGNFPSLRGGKLKLAVVSYGYQVNDANIKTPEIVTGTGIVHLIDRVLLEPADRQLLNTFLNTEGVDSPDDGTTNLQDLNQGFQPNPQQPSSFPSPNPPHSTNRFSPPSQNRNPNNRPLGQPPVSQPHSTNGQTPSNQHGNPNGRPVSFPSVNPPYSTNSQPPSNRLGNPNGRAVSSPPFNPPHSTNRQSPSSQSRNPNSRPSSYPPVTSPHSNNRQLPNQPHNPNIRPPTADNHLTTVHPQFGNQKPSLGNNRFNGQTQPSNNPGGRQTSHQGPTLGDSQSPDQGAHTRQNQNPSQRHPAGHSDNNRHSTGRPQNAMNRPFSNPPHPGRVQPTSGSPSRTTNPNQAQNNEQIRDIAEFAKTMGLNRFANWISNTGLLEKVHDGGVYTIFAPTDDAVNSLPGDIAYAIDSNPDQSKPLLQYHIVPQRLNLNSVGNEETAATLLHGKRIRFNVYQNGQPDCKQLVTASGTPIGDSFGAMGSVQVIPVNQVLYQPKGDLMNVVETSPILQDLAKAIRSARLNWMLSSTGPITFFAPSNTAFQNLSDEEKQNLIENKQAFTDLVKRHMVRGTLFSSGVQDGLQKRSENGQMLQVSLQGGVLTVNSVPVTYSDVTTTNGVLHVVDQFL